MKQIVFRDLRPEEIEVRIGNIIKDKDGKPKAFQLLLYKTSRTDMIVLDETFGTFGWRNHFYQVKNTMVCSIEVYDEETGQWINKDNGGDDDFTVEQVKAELSDSLKRAGSTLGIGRKLYTASKIYMVVNIDENNTTKSYYQVKEVEYDDTSITKLVVINKKTKEEVITYGVKNTSQNGNNQPKSSIGSGKGTIRPTEKDKIAKFIATLDQDKLNKFLNWLESKYHTLDFNELSDEQGIMVCVSWKL